MNKIPTNIQPRQFWHVIYECRDTIVEIDATGKGFFAFGQDAIWALSAVSEWIKEIPLDLNASEVKAESSREQEQIDYIEWLAYIKDEDEDFYDYHREMNHLEMKDD